MTCDIVKDTFPLILMVGFGVVVMVLIGFVAWLENRK